MKLNSIEPRGLEEVNNPQLKLWGDFDIIYTHKIAHFISIQPIQKGANLMPCIFLELPHKVVFNPNLLRQLHFLLASADGSAIGSFELHSEVKPYTLLLPDGTETQSTNVHCVVEGHSRSLTVKNAIAIAIDLFLNAHGIGKGSDITFRDSMAETFWFEGEMLVGGPQRNQ